MKPFKDYDKTQAFAEYERLPKGGYILNILNASEKTWASGDKYIEIACDIAEGDYNGFFAKQYKEDTREDKKWKCNIVFTTQKADGTDPEEWAVRKFKTAMNAIEGSNPGYHWDWNEAGLKGKKVGGLFNIRQYTKSNGDIGEFTNLAQLVSIEKIKSGTYKLPKDKLLEQTPTSSEGFMDLSGLDAELPFS